MEAVQSLVDDLSVAIDSFQLYSLEPDNYPAPDAEIYAKLLIDGADGLVASVNSVLADSDVTIGSSVRSEVQALVDSYAALNAYVSEEVGAVIPDHALLVGLGLSQLTDARAETYLLDYLPDLGVEDVDRVSKLSAYVDAINALFYVADADPALIGADEAAISVAQLALLGHAIDPADHKTLLSYVAEQGDGADADVVVGASNLQFEVRAVVEAYNAVLAAADGLDDDDVISVEQLSEIGVDQISSDVDMASLLFDVIEQREAVDVATTADLQALSDAVRALEDTIANGVAATMPVTAPQLTLLGVVGATDDNIDAIQITLSEGKNADYTSLSALQARVTTTVTALDKLTYHSVLDADAANNPVLQDYLDAGIAGVGDTAGDDNLLAVNAQLR
ncbi:MAG: hypothetical protein EBV86_17595, partial [Marivivens sp.]|nr:hypothetical protein [Marivivens sp.]